MKVLIKTPMTNVYSRPSDKSEVVTQAVFATEVEIIGENDFCIKSKFLFSKIIRAG